MVASLFLLAHSMAQPIIHVSDAHLAFFSKLVYSPWSVVHRTIECRGGEHYEQWDRFGTQAFLAVFRDTIVVVFAGSAEPIDWMHNFDAVLEDWHEGWGKVHRGFLTAANYVASSVVELALSLYQRGMRVIFTGHSLGAACATTVAVTFATRRQGQCECVTFGSPRVGNSAFAKRFNADRSIHSRRYVNNNDVVAHFPPCFPWLLPQFVSHPPWMKVTVRAPSRHVQELYYISNGEGVILDPSLLSRINWGARGVLNHFGKRGLDSFEDHRIRNYSELLGGDRLFIEECVAHEPA